MNIGMAFHHADKEQVQRWLSWCEELGGMGRHAFWLMPAKGQNASFQTGIPFRMIRDEYGVETDWALTNEAVRDAAGANTMIRQMAWHFYGLKSGPWMFLEPDAIPTREGWHDALEDEYQMAKKRFMGALVPGKANDYPDHPTGNMIYPQDAVLCSRLMLPTHATFGGRTVELAFDIAAAEEILGPNFHNTRLIQHVFRGPKFQQIEDLARLDPKAVIWHSDKDGGLIQLLRQRKKGGDVPLKIISKERPEESSQSSTDKTPNLPSNAAATFDPKPPRVYTYFRPCVDPEALAEQKRILEIWTENWKLHGWEPVILTEADARKHSEFEKLRERFEKLPTVSPKEYEMSCWLRWLAMASSGGGLMTDYDVLNNGWKPEMVPKWSDNEEMALPFILSTNNPVPCAVIGPAAAYERAAKAFSKATERFKERGHQHVSDQLLIQRWGWPSNDTCREFGRDGWELSALVHFSHAVCGSKRSNRMKEFVFKAPMSVPMIYDSGPPKLDRTRKPRTPADCIAELVDFSKKDGLAKGRIVKQLRKAGLIPKK